MVELNGCSSDIAQATRVEVEIVDMPEVSSVGNAGPFCGGDTIQLQAPTIPGASYQWTGPNGFGSQLEDPIILNGGTHNSGTYTLEVENGHCVSEPISIQVFVTEQPLTPIVDNTGPGCEGQRIQLTTPSVQQTGNVQYEWTGPNGFTSSEQNPILDSLDVSDEGAYQLTVIVNGCSSNTSASTIVEVNSTPVAPIATNNTDINDPLCAGETIQLETPFIPGATYQWIGPNGFTADIANPIIENASENNVGQYGVIVTVNGCSTGMDTTNVYVYNTIPKPISLSNGPVCEGDDLILRVNNLDSTLTYTWYDSISNVVVGTDATLILSNANESGTYYVVASQNSCESQHDFISVQILSLIHISEPTRPY